MKTLVKMCQFERSDIRNRMFHSPLLFISNTICLRFKNAFKKINSN